MFLTPTNRDLVVISTKQLSDADASKRLQKFLKREESSTTIDPVVFDGLYRIQESFSKQQSMSMDVVE